MTAKLRGQISQGLFMPINLFPELKNSIEGDDVTELLGVEKWEPIIPEQLMGKVIGGLPAGIRSTSQERIQNLGNMMAREIAGQTFEKSIKLDGDSMTVFHHENMPGVASKNWSYLESEDNLLWRVARKNKLIEALTAYGKNIALRGEIIGEGIQENHEKIKGNDFYLFNIFDIDANENMPPKERDAVVEELKALGATIHQVPSEGFITFDENVTIEDILAMADGKSLFAQKREGLVFKRVDGLFSFKAISNWYLLKYGNR
jgi:RNA ligase (TIGR02306 family)